MILFNYTFAHLLKYGSVCKTNRMQWNLQGLLSEESLLKSKLYILSFCVCSFKTLFETNELPQPSERVSQQWLVLYCTCRAALLGG